MKTNFLLISVIALTISANAQVQIGQDLNGEAAGDRSGCCVSMPDANTVAIGAPFNSESGLEAGHVRIYTLNGLEWVQKGADIDGEAAGDNFGGSVSMPDSNTVAIGATKNDGNGTDAGHVRIYSWNGSAWVQKGEDIDGESTGDVSGSSVSMPDANTVAIGARYNGGTGLEAGHVRIYFWDGSAWVQKGADIDGEAAGDQSGHSVSMPDSNTVAIGAYSNNGNGNQSGHVRIYSWNGIVWMQKGADIDGEAAGDISGSSVSMPDSNTVAIGAPLNNGNYSGHVRIYSWNGSVWMQKGADIDGEAAGDLSGVSVNMPDSNIVAIGAYYNDGGGTDAGHVRIYSWNGSAWVQKGADIDGEAAGDLSGVSVNMPDSNTVAIGAYYNDGGGTDAGHVRIYSLCTTFGTDVITACNSYKWIDGNTYTASNNTATYTLTNSAGCDSIVTLDLTINTVDVSVANTSPTLTANAVGATYQWLDCDNNMAVITGETDQSFIATANGNYAVEVTQNGCTDTSACVTVNNAGVLENDFGNALVVYPNPTSGSLSIDLSNVYAEIDVITRNYVGQEINRQTFRNTAKLQINVYGLAGIYLIEISADNKKALLKVIKE